MKRKLICVALWIAAFVATCYAILEPAISVMHPHSVVATTPQSILEWSFGLATSVFLLIIFAFAMMLLITLALGLRRL